MEIKEEGSVTTKYVMMEMLLLSRGLRFFELGVGTLP